MIKKSTLMLVLLVITTIMQAQYPIELANETYYTEWNDPVGAYSFEFTMQSLGEVMPGFEDVEVTVEINGPGNGGMFATTVHSQNNTGQVVSPWTTIRNPGFQSIWTEVIRCGVGDQCLVRMHTTLATHYGPAFADRDTFVYFNWFAPVLTDTPLAAQSNPIAVPSLDRSDVAIQIGADAIYTTPEHIGLTNNPTVFNHFTYNTNIQAVLAPDPLLENVTYYASNSSTSRTPVSFVFDPTANPGGGTGSSGGVGINTNTPDPSAILDVESTSQGFLPPRLTEAAMNTLESTAAEGLVVYCNDCTNKCLYVHDGTAFKSLCTP